MLPLLLLACSSGGAAAAPLTVAAARLDAMDGWETTDKVAIDAEVDLEIEAAIIQARGSAQPAAGTALDHMYATTYPGFPAGVAE